MAPQTIFSSFTPIARTERVLDEFFRWREQKVLLFKGGWGSGKSFFLRDYYIPKRTPRNGRESLLPEFISYTSVFGCKDIQEIEGRILSSLEKTTSFGLPRNRNFPRVLKELATNSIGKMELGFWGLKIPIPLSSLMPAFTRNKAMLIVLDDIERTNSQLRFGDILGLVSSLAENTSEEFKVILVCNESKLTADSEGDLATYREKVLHSELTYNPSPDELVTKFFPHPNEHEVMKDCLRIIKEGNIRIIRRVSEALFGISELIHSHSVELLPVDRDTIVRLCVFYYRANARITRDWFSEYYSRRGRESGQKDASTSSDDRLLVSLKASWHEFESTVVEWLNNGSVPDDVLNSIVQKLRNRSARERYWRAQEIAYSVYTDNFSEANPSIVAAPICKLLNDYAEKISLEEVLKHTSFLEKLGISGDKWIDQHVLAAAPKLDSSDLNNYLGRLLPGNARNIVQQFAASNTVQKDIGQIVTSMATTESWNSSEIEFLATATVKQYRTWLEMPGDPNTLSNLRVVLKWLKSTEPKDVSAKAHSKILETLNEMAKESPVHRARIEIFLARELKNEVYI